MELKKFHLFLIFYCYAACATVHCTNLKVPSLEEYRCTRGENDHPHFQDEKHTRWSSQNIFDDASDFDQSLVDPPLNLTINNVTDDSGSIQSLNLTMNGQPREYVFLTLLAIPTRHSNSFKCPELLNGSENLRRYTFAYRMYPETPNDTFININCIFTGCYYLMLDNEEGKRWQSKPYYYEADHYLYPDSEITVIGHPIYDEFSRTLEVDVILPLYYIQGKVSLCYKAECFFRASLSHFFIVENSTADVNITPVNVEIDESELLKGHISERINGTQETIISLRWENLLEDRRYYLRFSTFADRSVCNKTVNRACDTWTVPTVYTILSPEYRNETQKSPENLVKIDVLEIVCIVLAALATLVVSLHWIFRYVKLWKYSGKSNYNKLSEETILYKDQELKRILLIYEKGSPKFMKAMKDFREKLKQKCNCKVEALYSEEDFNKIARLNPARWLRDHMNSGGKFVWVDTPEFRSRFKNRYQQTGSTDFRSTAIPYAVSLTRKLFPNDASQYVCHFVVRVKGFEVENGRVNNPLLVVSPGTRYSYPDDIERLCESLKSTSDRSAEETSIEVIES